jgi:hypothetical protein
MIAARVALRIPPVVFISKNYSVFISLRWISGRAGVAS